MSQTQSVGQAAFSQLVGRQSLSESARQSVIKSLTQCVSQTDSLSVSVSQSVSQSVIQSVNQILTKFAAALFMNSPKPWPYTLLPSSEANDDEMGVQATQHAALGLRLRDA